MKYDKKSLRKRIGESLKRYREEILNENQTDVSNRCSLSISSINNIEKEKGTLSLDTLCKIIKDGYKIDTPLTFIHDPNPFLRPPPPNAAERIVHIRKDSDLQEIKSTTSLKHIIYKKSLAGAKIKFRRLILRPGEDTKEFTTHQNEELAYIEEGRNIKFDFKDYAVIAINQGEIIHFVPALLHKVINEDKKIEAKILRFEPAG